MKRKIKNKNKIRHTVFACILLGIIYGGCHDDSKVEKPAVEYLSFINSKVSMKIGERQAVKVEIKPTEARKYHPVEYAASVEGIVTVSESSNDGCVLTAEKGGTAVIIAKAGGYTAYLEVIVDHTELLQVPYIMVPTQVIEVGEGSRKSVQVSLFNGSAVDQQQFKWAVEPGKDNISINPTGNTVVVQGEKRGSQKIIVSHEKSEFTAEVLVFVLGVDEKIKYITTNQNVILMAAGGENKQFSAMLINGGPTDIAGFTFNIIEENPCISILSGNNTCNVMAKRKGTAVIRIQHPLAEYPLDVRVIVLEGEESYIELNKTFVMLDIGQGAFINANIGGEHKESWNGDFTYTLKGDIDCVDINQTNFSFYTTALKSGKCVIEIANKNIEYSREALIVVRDANMVPPDEYYISTSQNVLQLEIGQKLATELNIQLINGNDGDKAGFEWTVEDGSVVEVDALDLPSGKNVNYLTRGIKNRAQADIKMIANTLAMVTPKKVGMTKIIVSHPKSVSVATVICKVYPRGTFANAPFILESDVPKGGFIKVDTALPDTAVKLKMASGAPLDVGDLDWSVQNTDLAETLDWKRLENYIHGKSKGVTKLIVNNMNLKYPYEATVMVGTTEELVSMNALYVDQVYQTVAVGQSISVQVKNSGGENNALSNNGRYFMEGYDKTIVAATMINSRLLLQGLVEGETIITVGNSSSADITPTQVKVVVVSNEINLSQPYTINGPNFIGLIYGETKTVSVNLTDATPVEKDKVVWRSDNAAIVKVTGNGEQAVLATGNTIGQANITVSHSRSINEKIIVAYVVPPGVDPEKIVVLGIEKDHWLLKPGEEVMMRLITNADETAERNINDIIWGSSDISVASVDYNGSRAFVTARGTGSAVIMVTHPKKAIDLKIYVSVSDMPLLGKDIILPGIIELIIGENKVVTAVTKGLSEAEIRGITWSIDDSGVAGISGEGVGLTGGKLFIQGKDRGQAWLTARQDSFGYMKKVLVVCARTYDELMNTYVMTSEESYYRMKVGDSRDIRLIFGSAGFPESEKKFITWKEEGNKVVKIYDGGGGDHAKIEAAAPGITTVTVDHRIVSKPVTIMFEAYNESVTGTNYAFNSNTLMMGLAVKKTSDPENDDNTKILHVSIFPAGPSYSGIQAVDEEPSKNIFTFSKVSNELRITGTAKGQSYLRISHPQVADDLRVLIYTADTKTELDNLFPIGLSKPNYLLTIGGESQYIRLTTPPDTAPGYADKIRKIGWAIDNTRIVDYEISADKKVVKIEGRNAGNCVFDIKYDNIIVEKAYVSVKSKMTADMNKRIVTENIIGLQPGKTRKTSIGSNLTPDEKHELKWRVANANIVSITPVPEDESSQYLTAVSPGETEVVVSFGQIERFIKVYVNANVDDYKAVNLDNRYYQLRRNDEMTITAFHAALPCVSDDNWTFYPLDNQVVEFEKTGKDKVKIKGINEGIAEIVLSNGECNSDVTFFVEVSNTAPDIKDVIDDWYMTAFKTVYALDPAKTMDWTRVTVNGIRFPAEQLSQISWRVKSEEVNGVKRELGKDESGTLIDLSNTTGAFVDIAPKNKTGTVVLEASHPRSVNKTIEITVICSAAMVQANPVPHIATDKEIVKIQKYGLGEVTVRIEDLPGAYDISKFTAISDNTSKVTVQTTGNRITIRGVDFGQALLTITHPSVPDMQKKIVVMVLASNDLIYLTTRQNFVVLEKNSYQAIETELVGFTDINNRNYIWSTDDWDIISISDSGRSAVVTAKDIAKTAKITVTHVACPEYPLFIYVRVTDKLSAKPVYITTNNNIVSMKEGVSMQIKASLVNGGGYELSQFRWSTGDRHLIELNYSGDTAMIKGLQPGTAQVVIWHPSSLNSVNILVVVEPVEPNNGIYITTDTLLVEVATTEKQRLIKARLIGGNAEDIYGFQWSVTQWKSTLVKNNGTSYQVIDMNSNADMCYIYPHSEGGICFEGEAVLTVSHPKTNYKLDIKIIICDKTDIVFGQTYVTMDQYTQLTVPVTASSSGRLSYTSTNGKIVSVEGTDKLCVLNALTEGTVIIIASNMSGTKSAELIVRVNPVDKNDYFYLKTDSNIVTLSTTGGMRTISGEVINVKTGIKDEELTKNIKWKIKESDRTKGVVRLNNSSNAAITVTHNEVNLYPGASGDIEVIFGFFELDDPLLAKYPTLKDNCAGKSVYVKVETTNSQFILSHAVIRMNEAETIDEVWARLDNVSPTPDYNHWDQGGNIVWRSEKPEVVAIVYRNDTNQRSNVSLVAMKPGNAQIFVNYGASQQVISVVVSANSYIQSTKSNVTIMPDLWDIFTITSNPVDKNITVTVDSNMSCSFEGRQAGDTEWLPIPANFITQTKKQKDNGLEGYEFRVIGNKLEGIAIMTFEMKETGKKTQVTITNMKNYYVKWRDKAQMRFEPKETDTEKLRLYYTISPSNDELIGISYLNKFRIIPGKSEDGQTKWIDFVHPFKTDGSNTPADYFGTCGITVTLFTKITNAPIDLDVYIYYENIDIKWSQGTISYITTSDVFTEANQKSIFDAVNYSATVGNNEKININMDVDNTKYGGHEIDIVVEPIKPENGSSTGVIYNPHGVYIQWSNNKNNTNTVAAYITDVTYLGLLKVCYSYFNGGKNRTTFYRNILVYGANVSRKK